MWGTLRLKPCGGGIVPTEWLSLNENSIRTMAEPTERQQWLRLWITLKRRPAPPTPRLRVVEPFSAT